MADGDLRTPISRNENDNTSSNVLFVQIADDAGNVAGITSSALDVNATVTLETAYVDDSAFTVGTDKVNAQGFGSAQFQGPGHQGVFGIGRANAPGQRSQPAQGAGVRIRANQRQPWKCNALFR